MKVYTTKGLFVGLSSSLVLHRIETIHFTMSKATEKSEMEILTCWFKATLKF